METSMTEEEGAKTPAKLGAITLTRHGKPKVRRRGWCDRDGFNTWWAAYEAAGLTPNSRPPEVLRQEAERATQLFMSPKQRAVETARAAAGDRPVEANDLFLEAPLPAPPLPFHMPVTFWWVISWFYWWFGFKGDFEHRNATNARATAATEFLIAEAAKGDVLVCAHGWFNRMVGWRLRRKGWRMIYNGGDAFWGWRKYLPPE